ncbi:MULTISPECIES: hypothetical protein [Serratia]|jgi:hypothetical protein|uniref:hypothetical protein n=1 Tax=Serratia TaxID=613 RepID=UPI0011AB7F92|nr:hypothetical protein [Serratia marcescens]MBH3336067.1 hypothetical protein [Serratia marcescens]
MNQHEMEFNSAIRRTDQLISLLMVLEDNVDALEQTEMESLISLAKDLSIRISAWLNDEQKVREANHA